MAKRRGSGEGSIFKRSDGKWVASVDLGWKAGKRQRKVLYGKTRADVATRLRQLQSNVDRGIPISDERRTTAEYLTWWSTNVLPGTVKSSTADDYRWVLERYVIPHVGRVRLSKLNPQHVQSMLRELEDAGLSPRTRRYARAVLRSALSHAEKWELVPRNAAALVDSPRLDGPCIDDALDVAQARRLLDAADRHRLAALVTVALALGLRRGEGLALQWADVDFERSTITVNGTLKRQRGVGLVVDTPKTVNGRRTIALPTICVRSLREHKLRQAREHLAAGPHWSDTGFVFVTPIGTPIDPRNLTREFHKICGNAGLPRLRFHALRHSAATIMLAQGVPLEVISKTLGHGGYAITADIYAKVRDDLQRTAATAIDDAFRKSS
jgi:integrase